MKRMDRPLLQNFNGLDADAFQPRPPSASVTADARLGQTTEAPE